LKHFVRDGFGIEKNRYFDYAEFSVAYNPVKFQQILEYLGKNAYSSEIEKEAIDLFIKSHSDALKKTVAVDSTSPDKT